MEEEFSKIMINKMKETISHEDPQSTAEEYYQDLLTQKQAESLSSQNTGKGIQKLIMNQIYPEHIRTPSNFERFQQNEASKIVKERQIRQQDRGTNTSANDIAPTLSKQQISIYKKGGTNE